MADKVISLPEMSIGDVNAQTNGLSIAGKVTIVALASGSWTALPATALANRNAITVQNESGIQVKLGYDAGEAGFIGVTVNDGGERFYNITDDIIIYAKSASGTPSITVEELS